MDLSKLDQGELILLYGDVISELQKRKIIRSKNVVGDLGEHLAVDYYSKTPGLPGLQFTPKSTKNIDAISIQGERYSIKATTSNVTGAFFGLEPKGSEKPQKQLFEYVIVVTFNDSYQLQKIIELDWTTFMAHKKWHSRIKAWHLILSKKMLSDAKIIFDCAAK